VFYCCYAFGLFPVLYFIETTARFGEHVSLLCLVAIAIIAVIFFILAAVKIFQMSRSGNFGRNVKFQELKERFELKVLTFQKCLFLFLCRFWNYLELIPILIVTFTIELHSHGRKDEPLNAFIIEDFTKAFTAVMIFVILVLKKRLKNSFDETIRSNEGNLDHFDQE
jgi:hypothetical protein